MTKKLPIEKHGQQYLKIKSTDISCFVQHIQTEDDRVYMVDLLQYLSKKQQKRTELVAEHLAAIVIHNNDETNQKISD